MDTASTACVVLHALCVLGLGPCVSTSTINNAHAHASRKMKKERAMNAPTPPKPSALTPKGSRTKP